MQWVPEDQRNSAWYLFNVKFLCRVPYLESRSLEDIRMFGTPHVGIPEFDEQTSKELVDRLLTISEIADYFEKGVSVYVKRMEDTKTIYDHIRKHLMTWEAHLQRSFDTKGAPIDDLVRLDKLAQSVYAHAKPFITVENQGVFERHLNTFSRKRGLSISAAQPKEAETPLEEQTYDSMARAFVSMRRERG